MAKKELTSKMKNGYERITKAELKEMDDYCEQYMAFLDNGKTERECVTTAIALAEAKGFKKLERGMKLKAGDKVYYNNCGKNLNLAVIGKEALGANIVAAHIDSPRLDLKPQPLYEDHEMAYLKTHYYGGVRKYQWVTIPLELHGVVCLTDGTTVEVKIGEGNEPKLVITDLLPHLAQEQSKKPLSEAITGEGLTLLVGSVPVADKDVKERTKERVLEILNKKYGITEDDFISAELETVPSFDSTLVGLDGSLIGAYGHDDRVCAYAGLKAIFDIETPEKTAVLVMADKEEIGSVGLTGMISQNFENFINIITGGKADMYEYFEKSFCLSSDVTAAMDPLYADAFEDRNSAHINYGIGLCKYTGSRGKGGASDANAETVAKIRRIFDENGVVWQMAELGRIDLGGGGTVALDMSNRNIETIDAGVPVLSMHSPYEIVSKLDCYMTYKGCKAVYESK
ncbi:MAG: aminopeptidase [Clostridia bacterium]|nr:aminopeptidase [Clostridia bacterium]